MEQTTLASWVNNKSHQRTLATIFFSIFLATFLVSFVFIYIILKSTNPFTITIPLILFLPVLPALREVWSSLTLFKESTQVYLTDTGVYARDLEKPNEYKFLAWELIRQYDIIHIGSAPVVGVLIPKPTRFLLRGKHEEDSFVIDAYGDNADILEAYLKEHEIPFGFMKDG